MIAKLKNLKEIHVVTIVVLVLFTLAFLVHIVEQNKLEKEELKETQSYLDAGGNPEEIDLYDLKTKAARDYVEQAVKNYAAIVEATPTPKISFITPYIIEEQTYNLMDGPTTITDYVISTESAETEFTIEFTVENGTEAFIYQNGWGSDEKEPITLDGSGVFRATIELTDQENDFTIDVANEYKEDSIDIIVRREETSDERDLRIKIEQKNLGWTQSEAGQICARHPDWEKYDCTRVAEGEIWIGMYYKMLLEQRGEPTTTSPSDYGSEIEWQWCWSGWTPFCFYDDNNDGIVDSYN